MPIAPPPMTYRCPACRWSKTVAPTSDCLVPGFDYFSACPVCGQAPLDEQATSALRAAVARTILQLRHLRK